jgi:chromate transporter
MTPEINPKIKLVQPDRPNSRRDVFITFTWLALQGFGGVLPLMQKNLVERRNWLTDEEFLDDWAVAQILPGSNIFNFALIVGRRLLGVPGAVAAMAGMLVVPMAVALLMVALFTGLADSAAVRGAIRGMGIVSAGLLILTSGKLLVSSGRGPCGMLATSLFAVLTWYANGVLHLPLYTTLFGLGAIAWLWAYVRMPAYLGERPQP